MSYVGQMVTITSIDKAGREYTDTYVWRQRYQDNLKAMMKEAKKRFTTYTITAPDGTVIAKLK